MLYKEFSLFSHSTTIIVYNLSLDLTSAFVSVCIYSIFSLDLTSAFVSVCTYSIFFYLDHASLNPFFVSIMLLLIFYNTSSSTSSIRGFSVHLSSLISNSLYRLVYPLWFNLFLKNLNTFTPLILYVKSELTQGTNK